MTKISRDKRSKPLKKERVFLSLWIIPFEPDECVVRCASPFFDQQKSEKYSNVLLMSVDFVHLHCVTLCHVFIALFPTLQTIMIGQMTGVCV